MLRSFMRTLSIVVMCLTVAIFVTQRGGPSRVWVSLQSPVKDTNAAKFTETYDTSFDVNPRVSQHFEPSDRTRQSVRQNLTLEGEHIRVWHSFSPEITSERPVLILLHDSAQSGLSMIEMWRETAERHGLILLAPNALETGWPVAAPAPGFLARLLEEADKTYPINRAQVFLFGHSNGAIYGQHILNWEGAPWKTAVWHGGYVHPENVAVSGNARAYRLYIGDKDRVFSVDAARDIGIKLAALGTENELVIIPGHNHWFYDIGPQIAEDAWIWLRDR